MNTFSIIIFAILCGLLIMKHFYIAKDEDSRWSIQYWDRITSTLFIILFMTVGYKYLPEIYFKITSLLLGLFIYLFAIPISAPKNTRWTEANRPAEENEYNIYFRGRFRWNAVKLYFTPIDKGHVGTQYFVINWLKGWGTILMTGVIPELLKLLGK